MQGSKLLQTLGLFSKSELDSLDKFLQSPYFYSEQTPKEIYPLFHYIMSYSANWDHPKLQKKAVYKHLYPRKKVISGKVDKLMSALVQQIHSFIGIHFSAHQTNKISDKISIINFFRKRSAGQFSVHYLNKLKKSYEKESIHDKAYYFNGHLLNSEILQNELIGSTDLKSLNIVGTNKSLDIFYILNKLENACFLLSIDRFRQPIEIKMTIQFLDKLKPICVAQNLLKTPLVAIYYQTFEMLKKVGESDSAYWELKELIEENSKYIPKETLKSLNGLIRNFMTYSLNHGATHLLEEIFSLYKDHLKKGFLNHENGILSGTFKNLVALGLRTKNFNWVFDFLKRYKNKIKGTKFPEDIYQYNLAYYYFALNEYEMALDLIADRYDDIFYKISAKRMELKIYYELKSKILPSKIDAFKVYIFRLPKKAILDHVRENNNLYVNFLRQLSNPKTAIDPKRIERLNTKINNSKLLTEKDWLLEKLAEFKK